MDFVRDLVSGLLQHGYGVVEWALGRDCTAHVRRWFAATYRDQPLLFGLIATWLVFCAVPLAVFVGYAAVWAAVAFGVFWAIFLFWAGLGLLFLVPALFVATGLSLAVFAWAAVTYLVGVRVLAAAGYDGPLSFSFSGIGDGDSEVKVKTADDDKNGNKDSNDGKATTDKPPSYALLPAPVNKSLDIKPRVDFGTPPLSSPGEVPVSTK
ncbi:MAG: hypothetical protein STHCBS139747_003036 [Sporothrix thermara]